MVAHTLPINVVDFVCSVNVVVAVNAPTVKIPEAKVAKEATVKVAKMVAINGRVNDANSVHAVKVAVLMDHVVSVIVDHVAMKMAKSSMVMAMVLVRPAKVLVKVKVAKMDARNVTSDAISADHHVDHVAADHHAPAKEMMVMPKVAMLAKMA